MSEYGHVRLEPDGPVVAGDKGTWRIVYTAGKRGIAPGGALRIRPPQLGMVRWQVGLVTAQTSRPGVTCRVELINCHPLTYHWRQAPMVQVDILGGRLQPGDTVTVTVGERGGYSRGYAVRAQAQDHAVRGARWDVWVDAEGNKSLQREREINDPWAELDSMEIDVVAGPAAQLSIAARQPRPGETDTRAVVAARDRFGNHADTYRGAARLLGGGPVTIEAGRADLRLPLSEGVTRHTLVDPDREIIGTGNPVLPGFSELHEATHGLNVYFGDLHVMTGEGIIAGALEGTEYAYRWGRDVGGLDFCVATNNLGCWDADLPLDDAYNTSGEFVTLPAFEIGFRIGHKNVYFPDTDARKPDGSSPEGLFASLRGREALVIPHHTSVHSESSYETYWTEHQLDVHDPELERLIEITQDRGSMETEEVGGNVYFGGMGSSVQAALRKGMKLGFVGGTDSHRAQPGEPRTPLGGLDPDEVTVGGLTAVLAPELTRQAVFKALRSRRCYATQGQRTLLLLSLGDSPMGSIVPREAGERRFCYAVVGHRALVRLELVRCDGQVTDLIPTDTPTRELVRGEWLDETPLSGIQPAGDAVWYYLRATEDDGRMAWSSPIWMHV